MPKQTTQTILEELEETTVDIDTGEITDRRKRTRTKRVSKVKETDEFVKVSKYLNVIFAYQGIPLNLVPISLLIAQRMEFKTNRIVLLKDDKEELAQMLNMSVVRVNALIQDLKKYDILRPISRGKYEVNSYLYSTGDLAETRELQAHFDIMRNELTTVAEQTNCLNGETVRKIVRNYKKAPNKQIDGQMSLEDFTKR